MRFRKKPTIIEANQFNYGAILPQGVHSAEDGRAYVVTAHEQRVYLESGDWIVAEPGLEGRFYPIKNEIFTSTYEPVP